MASSATGVTPTERPVGNTYVGSFVVDPASQATLTQEIVTITVAGVAVGDVATVCPRTALTVGIVIASVRCSANTITVYLFNASAGTIDLASGTWDYAVFRGSTGPLR